MEWEGMPRYWRPEFGIAEIPRMATTADYLGLATDNPSSLD